MRVISPMWRRKQKRIFLHADPVFPKKAEEAAQIPMKIWRSF